MEMAIPCPHRPNHYPHYHPRRQCHLPIPCGETTTTKRRVDTIPTIVVVHKATVTHPTRATIPTMPCRRRRRPQHHYRVPIIPTTTIACRACRKMTTKVVALPMIQQKKTKPITVAFLLVLVLTITVNLPSMLRVEVVVPIAAVSLTNSQYIEANDNGESTLLDFHPMVPPMQSHVVSCQKWKHAPSPSNTSQDL